MHRVCEMLIRWAAYKLVFAEPNFSRDAVMQLCSRRRVCCRLVVRAATVDDAIAIYAPAAVIGLVMQELASVNKGTRS